MATDTPAQSTDLITPLEASVLAEYEALLKNLNRMSATLHSLAGTPTAELLDGLRGLERKTGLVFTLLKASVYTIVLQQEVYSGGETGNDEHGEGRG